MEKDNESPYIYGELSNNEEVINIGGRCQNGKGDTESTWVSLGAQCVSNS